MSNAYQPGTRFVVARFLGLVVLILLVGCAGGGANSSNAGAGDPERGRKLFFNTQQMTGAPTCSTCHVVEPDEPALVGPNLDGLHIRAGERVPGQSAEDYIRTSIVDPYAYVLQGYQSGIMVRNYEEKLTEQQINDLVAYLMTL